MFYSYLEVRKIRDELCDIVNRIRLNPMLPKEVKEAAEKMVPCIPRYNVLLSSMSVTGFVKDKERIEILEKTQKHIKELRGKI